MRDKIVFAAYALMAAGCAGVEWTSQALETDSKQYAEPLKLTQNRVTINVYWKSESEIVAFCRSGNACALPMGEECNIFTVKPRSWNSAPLLKRLGHEVAHCLGGKHE